MSTTSLPSAIAANRQLQTLAHNLDGWVFTDFDRARQALDVLADGLGPKAPFELRLAYHRHAAFLHNQWQHYEPALEHARTVVRLLENRRQPAALVEAWADVAAIHLNRRDWSAAQTALDHARKHMSDATPETVRAHVAGREGFFHLHLNNPTQALAAFQEAEKGLLNLEEDAALKHYYIFTLVLSGLGDLYERLGDKENSLRAYRRVLPIVESRGLRPRRAWHYLNAGRAALASDDTEEAKFFFEQVLKFADEGDTDARTHALGNLGILAFLSDQADRAVALLNEAAAQYENPVKESDFTNLAKIEGWRAGLLLRSGDTAAAEAHLEKAYAYGEHGLDRQHQAQVCLNLAALYAEQRDFEKAYRWQRRATELTSEYFTTLNNRERQELEVRHQLERSRQEAQLARLRVASLQLRALRAQMNPHFMFNALNAIQGLITSGRNTEAGDYLAKFAKMMRHTLEYSDLEVVTLEEEIEFLERYLDINRKLRFRGRLQFRIVPPMGADADEIHVPTMILQPFVENAIEHGLRPRQEGHLRLEFQLGADGQTLLCTIEDDGIGYNHSRQAQSAAPEFQQHRSRGMDITRERLTLLHQLQQRPDAEPFIKIIDLADRTGGQRSGTRVEVVLPVMEG
jgi:two-component system LytT family sensor kinase